MAPSVKALEAAFPGKGAQLRALLTGTVEPETVPETAAWVAECYHRPRLEELIEHAVNVVMDGHGCEAIFQGCTPWPDLSYINMGDPYVTTLLHYWKSDTWRIGCWGDFIESQERRGIRYA